MIRWRPSGEATIDIGKSPAARPCPAGAMRQPLGRSVTPRPSGPGRGDGSAARCAIGTIAKTIHTNRNDRAPPASLRLVINRAPARKHMPATHQLRDDLRNDVRSAARLIVAFELASVRFIAGSRA